MGPLEPLLTAPVGDRRLWPIDPEIIFLNHGSFGSCPRPVLEFQQHLRERMEGQPVQFFVRDLEGMLDAARDALARFLGAPAHDLVFVANATAGVNTVLRSLQFERGDELLVTNHEYNACRNTLEFVAARRQATVRIAEVPFPLRHEDEIIEAVMRQVMSRSRLVLLDHVTSQTGLIFPIERLVSLLAQRGIDTLVDGAHAPGMIELQLSQIGAAYYTGNCHKWLCAPKGAGFLYVRPDRQKWIRPLSISHGASSPRTDRSRFLIEFGWAGTWDPTACLCVPEAIRFMAELSPGGWPRILERNRHLALKARRLLCDALKIERPCPDDMVGSLAAIPLPDATGPQPEPSPLYSDPLQDKLRLEHGIEVPVIAWPAPPKRLLRLSAQVYNSLADYERLAAALSP